MGFLNDELVRLSSYQTLGGGISEYFGAEQRCAICAALELSLGNKFLICDYDIVLPML